MQRPMIERHSDPIEILRAAKRLLAHEDRLVLRGTHTAEDDGGNEVSAYTGPACRFCMLGAISASTDTSVKGWFNRHGISHDLMARACAELGYSYGLFMDQATWKRLTVAQVQQVFDLAIMLGGGTDANAPQERDSRTGMTIDETEAARQVLNEALPGLGDRALDRLRAEALLAGKQEVVAP